MFYVSCIVSQLVFSCGLSKFKGGIGSEMVSIFLCHDYSHSNNKTDRGSPILSQNGFHHNSDSWRGESESCYSYHNHLLCFEFYSHRCRLSLDGILQIRLSGWLHTKTYPHRLHRWCRMVFDRYRIRGLRQVRWQPKLRLCYSTKDVPVRYDIVMAHPVRPCRHTQIYGGLLPGKVQKIPSTSVRAYHSGGILLLRFWYRQFKHHRPTKVGMGFQRS